MYRFQTTEGQTIDAPTMQRAANMQARSLYPVTASRAKRIYGRSTHPMYYPVDKRGEPVGHPFCIRFCTKSGGMAR